MRSLGAAFAVASLLFAACLPSADATAQAQKRKAATKSSPGTVKSGWQFVRGLGGPTLEYRTSSEELQLSFSCQPETGLLRVIAQIGTRGLQPGDGAAIRLTNGKNRFEIAGTAFSGLLRQDVNVGGATRFDSDLLRLFLSGETVVVEVPGRKRSLPIANAGPSAAAFQKACVATAAARQAPAG
jgi:hypothetical protein